MKKFTPHYHYDGKMAAFDFDEVSNGKCVRYIDARYPGECKTWWPAFFPAAIGFLTSGTMENPNVMTISSMAVMCRDPFLIGMPVFWDYEKNTGRYTMELINKHGEFCCCIPPIDEKMTYALRLCGTYSGRNRRHDKCKESGLTFMPSKKVASPIIKECPVNVECKLQDKYIMGSHTWIVGKIETIHLNKDIVDEKAHLYWRSLPEYIHQPETAT